MKFESRGCAENRMIKYCQKVFLVGIVTFLLPCITCVAQIRYQLVDLGDLPGGTEQSFGYGINNIGDVVGESNVTGGVRGFLWSVGNSLTDVGDLPGGDNFSTARGINNSGTVVGRSSQGTNTHAFVWDNVNGMQDIGDFAGGVDSSSASDINELGQVAGHGFPTNSSRAFLWDSINGMQDLGVLSGQSSSLGNALNDSGIVVGSSGNRGFVWDAVNGMQDLGDLPGGTDVSVAFDINNSNQVVGASNNADGRVAIIWDEVSGLVSLGQLPNGNGWAEARGINDLGQVVGYSRLSGGSFNGFIWDTENGMQNLNGLVEAIPSGWFVEFTSAINESGQIVGTARDQNGVRHAILLNPVPEPNSFVFIAMATMGMIMVRRQHHHKFS